MPTWYKALLACCIGLSLAGCTVGTDEVLFVTATNIGIDADSKPPNLAIAYDRTEGYIGPSYDNGALPPVMSRIQSNLSVLNPAVRQIYATGDAATALAKGAASKPSERPLDQRKRVAYFITQSSIGLKVTFAETVPDSVHLGYKRKEFSYIPLGTATNGSCHPPDPKTRVTPSTAQSQPAAVDCYASVLATIEMGGAITDRNTTGLEIDQFFATGMAAEWLAATNPDIRSMFKAKILKSSITYKECDDNCEKLRKFAADTSSGSDTIREKCAKPADIALLIDLYRLPEHKDEREQCVKALKL